MKMCAARNLTAALVFLSCQIVLILTQNTVTWPNCPGQPTFAFKVQPGHTDPYVSELLLKKCKITEVTTDIGYYPQLKKLSISTNEIARFKNNVFNNLTALEELDLEYNRFQGRDLPPDLLRKCRKLRKIYFSYNDMSNTPEQLLQGLEELERLIVANCSLTTIPQFVLHPSLKKMTYLHLRKNKIARLVDPSTFINVPNIIALSLSSNEIDYIHKDIFKPLNKLVRFYMHTNKMRYIPEELFLNKSSLIYVELSYNRIEYIPVNAFLGTGMKALYLRGNRLTFLPENFFTQLSRSGAQLRNMYIGLNPLQCGCLNEIMIELKKFSTRINDGNYFKNSPYDGKRPACVFVDSFKCQRTDVYQRIYDSLVNSGLYSL